MQPQTLPEGKPKWKLQPESKHKPKHGHETKQECQPQCKLPHYEQANRASHDASASDCEWYELCEYKGCGEKGVQQIDR